MQNVCITCNIFKTKKLVTNTKVFTINILNIKLKKKTVNSAGQKQL